MRLTCIFAFLVLILDACGSSPMKMPDAPAPISAPATPVSMQEAFARALPLDKLVNRNLLFYSGQTPVVEFGSDRLFVIPVNLDPAKRHAFTVRSFVVQTSDGAFVLFYPLLSLVDGSYKVQQTLKPKFEFAFENNILTNEFEVGPGVDRMLIRTDAEYFRGPFEGTTSTYTPNRSADRYVGMAGAVGGAIGGAMGAGLVVWNASRGERKPFKLGEIGVINVQAD